MQQRFLRQNGVGKFIYNIVGKIVLLILGMLISNCNNAEKSKTQNCKYEIVFDSNRDGSKEIYALDIETKEVRRLTNSTNLNVFNRFPDWSHDGKHIVFVSNRDGSAGNLFIMNSDGSNVRTLTNKAGLYENPAWSPKGDKIAYVAELDGKTGLYIINVDGSGNHRIGPEIAYHPSWSPDGKRIAFITDVNNNIEFNENNKYAAAIMAIDGSNVRIITDIRHDVASIAWSPDGKRIAFDAVLNTNFDIFIISSDGSNQQRLTFSNAVESRPVWSPDGNSIVFNGTQDYGSVGGSEIWEEFELYLIDIKSLKVKRLTNNYSFDAHPDWCFN